MAGAGLPDVDPIWCHQPDARLMMVCIVPGEETAAEDVGGDVKMEAGPLHRPHQLAVRAFGKPGGALAAAFGDLALG